MCTYTDLAVQSILELGVFANYTEYHAFEMGILIPMVCMSIAYLDKRVAATTLGICVLAGFGVIPSLTATTAVGAKPWYFMGGVAISMVTIFSSLELTKRKKEAIRKLLVGET